VYVHIKLVILRIFSACFWFIVLWSYSVKWKDCHLRNELHWAAACRIHFELWSNEAEDADFCIANRAFYPICLRYANL